MSEVLLETRQLTKRFGGLNAIDGVDLRIMRGELRCLIGPNGAGKSTFFKLIMGTLRPTSGNILFDGADITRCAVFERARRGMSLKLQVPSVYLDLTVRDNMRIAVQHRLSGRDTEREVDRILDALNMAEVCRQPARVLSHGQVQWLDIGMALGTRPTMLLLDEPTAGMSPEDTARTAELVRHLHWSGMAIMVIDHDMAFVRQIADKISVMHYGRVFAEGTLAEIEAHEEVAHIYLGKNACYD